MRVSSELKLILVVSSLVLGAIRAQAMDSITATKVVTAAYEDVLGRKPDLEGMRLFRSKLVDEDWTEKQLRAQLRGSVEYRQTRIDAIIGNAYQDLLGRKVDGRGLRELRDKMLKKNWTEKQVRAWLRASEEYKRRQRRQR
jgi:hypothetical protein